MRGKSKGINQGEQGGTQLPDCMIPHRRFGVEEFFLRAMKQLVQKLNGYI